MSSSAKTLLVGGLVVAGALALIGGLASASSSSSSKPKGTPPPKPGPGATVENIPAGLAGQSIPALKRTTWRVAANASGQQAGLMILVQVASDPNEWVLLFKNEQSGGAGILGYSQTPMAGLIAQQLAAGF